VRPGCAQIAGRASCGDALVRRKGAEGGGPRAAARSAAAGAGGASGGGARAGRGARAPAGAGRGAGPRVGRPRRLRRANKPRQPGLRKERAFIRVDAPDGTRAGGGVSAATSRSSGSGARPGPQADVHVRSLPRTVRWGFPAAHSMSAMEVRVAVLACAAQRLRLTRCGTVNTRQTRETRAVPGSAAPGMAAHQRRTSLAGDQTGCQHGVSLGRIRWSPVG
jgi:hypothetical protein